MSTVNGCDHFTEFSGDGLVVLLVLRLTLLVGEVLGQSSQPAPLPVDASGRAARPL